MSALLLLTSLFYVNFFSRIIFSPLLPSIEQDLSLSHGKAGTIFLVLSCGYFISLVGSGYVSSWLGHKKTIVCSIFAISFSLFLTASFSSLPFLLTTFFLIGFSAGIYLPSGIATISELFSSTHWGKAFAVHELAPNLAFLTAPLFASFLLPILRWQQIVLILAMAAFIAGLLYHYFGPGKTFFGKVPDWPLCLEILRHKDFLVLLCLFALGISGTIGIFNILPLFLVTSHAYSLEDANLLVGMSRASTLVSTLLGGFIADRLGNRMTLAGALLLTGIATCGIGLAARVFLPLSIFLQPLLAVCFFPAGFALLSRLTGPEARNVVISLAIPLSFFIGGGVLPAVIAAMADAGLFQAGIILTGLLISSGSLLVAFLSNRLPVGGQETP